MPGISDSEFGESVDPLAPAPAQPAADALFVGDPTGVIVEVNAAACGLTGYRAGELLGMRSVDLIAPEWVDFAVRQRQRKLKALQNVTRYECALLAKDGARVAVEVTSSLLYSRDEVVGVRVLAREKRPTVTAETRLEEAEARFRGAFEGAAIGMALVAPDGRWLRVNDALSDLLGYTREELLDLSFQAVTHPDDLQRDLDAVRDVLDGRVGWYHMEKRYIRKDGTIVWGLLAVSLVRDPNGTPAYFVSQISDITAAKAAERAKLVALDTVDSPTPALSGRERDVVRLLAQGSTTVGAAEALGISDETVQTLVKRGMRKLRARNRTHLVAKALQLGLV